MEQGACHNDKHDDHCRATGVIQEINSSIVHVLSFLLLLYNAPRRARFLQWQGLIPERPTAAPMIAGWNLERVRCHGSGEKTVAALTK